jgi:hypothetical protein
MKLVEELVDERPRGDGCRQYGLVFGERLLGEQRPRQVQLACRPGRIATEFLDVCDGHFDLSGRECPTEGRHPPIECPGRAAIVADGEPVRRRLARAETAVGEVGQRQIEADQRLRRAAPIRAMAGGARRAVHGIAGVERLRGLSARGFDADDQDRENDDGCPRVNGQHAIDVAHRSTVSTRACHDM